MAALGDASIVAFLMKGLRRRAGERSGETKWSWRPNLPVLHAALPEIVRAVPLEMSTLPLLAIYGGKSGYVGEADLALMEGAFLQFESHCIPSAGHWLHAEEPAEFLEITSDFLN
jgi:pimeloyl-ACP methyl ester carboxylesterase